MFRLPVFPEVRLCSIKFSGAPFALAHHRSGPLLEERIAFLTHLANQGYSRKRLRTNARFLLAIAHTLGPASRPGKALTLIEVEQGPTSAASIAASTRLPSDG